MKIKIEVPKSGCRRTRKTGNKKRKRIMTQSFFEFSPSNFWMNHAINRGKAIFKTSDGCIFIKPKLIHLVAPLTVSPKNSVAISKKIVTQ